MTSGRPSYLDITTNQNEVISFVEGRPNILKNNLDKIFLIAVDELKDKSTIGVYINILVCPSFNNIDLITFDNWLERKFHINNFFLDIGTLI